MISQKEVEELSVYDLLGEYEKVVGKISRKDAACGVVPPEWTNTAFLLHGEVIARLKLFDLIVKDAEFLAFFERIRRGDPSPLGNQPSSRPLVPALFDIGDIPPRALASMARDSGPVPALPPESPKAGLNGVP